MNADAKWRAEVRDVMHEGTCSTLLIFISRKKGLNFRIRIPLGDILGLLHDACVYRGRL